MCSYESICVGSAESHPGIVLVPCSALGTRTGYKVENESS